ncbi:MAG: helix-turn-helix domain-containing protein [Thermoplasmatota archaeon]
MPAEEITFRVACEGPLTDFTRRHPGAALSLFCDWGREIVEITGVGEDDVKHLVASLTPRASWTETYLLDDATTVLMMDCLSLPHDFVNKAVDAAHCINIPPTRFDGGWETYNVVSFSAEKTQSLFKALRESGREVELVTKSPLKIQPLLNTRGLGANALFNGLTDKQVDAMLLAHKHGMYTSPRRTTAAAIADSLGLSRSTFEEHLRKAENRLVTNLVPYLELQARARKSAAAVANAEN